ncbi:hypothetical protein BE21_21140 [Sorangium cellulosum]|uniref:Peptidoglycan binding-like domain-containing protein n=1 Tax=Sorangium cellulosum TaxID=56 RepID=A0A150TW05_SORCE|nr:hypothetical protein BE21_21140 [Sorangium cellulosum]
MTRPHFHVVRSGDCIESVAAEVGCAWRDLWNYPRNQALRERRSSPSLLKPGDVVHIPEQLRPSPLRLRPGGTHRFRCELLRTTLRVRLVRRDAEGVRAIAGVPYRLVVGMTSIDGTTTADGHVEAEVPVNARYARLELSPGTSDAHLVDLDIGHLDPVDDGDGVLQRLHNLGLLRGSPTGEALTDAVATFQREHGLTSDGVLTDETVAQLREVHDG